MKQIFEWLREQMEWNQTVEMHFDGTPPKQYIESEKWVSVINEAEAKLEAECCEWKWGIDYAQVQCRGDKILFGSRRLFTYCPYCGKPIKISEVE